MGRCYVVQPVCTGVKRCVHGSEAERQTLPMFCMSVKERMGKARRRGQVGEGGRGERRGEEGQEGREVV